LTFDDAENSSTSRPAHIRGHGGIRLDRPPLSARGVPYAPDPVEEKKKEKSDRKDFFFLSFSNKYCEENVPAKTAERSMTSASPNFPT